MNQDQAKELGKLLRQRRQAVGLSQRRLAVLAQMGDSTIVRLEHGQFLAPSPAKLSRLAEALHLPLADLFALAAYLVPGELPSFEVYLQTKYPALPRSGVAELLHDFKKLQVRHGLHLDLTKFNTERLDNDQAGAAA
jgi:transcriptional regulator with XRE-family HTH domain